MASYAVAIVGAIATGTAAALSAHMLFAHVAAVIAGTLAGMQ